MSEGTNPYQPPTTDSKTPGDNGAMGKGLEANAPRDWQAWVAIVVALAGGVLLRHTYSQPEPLNGVRLLVGYALVLGGAIWFLVRQRRPPKPNARR